MLVIRHLAERGRRCKLRVVVDEDLLTPFAVLIARHGVELAENGPVAPIALPTLLVLVSRLLGAEVADSPCVLLRVEAVLLLSEQVAHGVSLTRVHGEGVARVGSLHELLCTLRLWQG